MPASVAAAVAPPAPRCTESSHEAIKTNTAKFAQLEFHSYWPLSGTQAIEQRHCPHCHSTLGRLVEVTTVRYCDEDDLTSTPASGGLQ